MFFFMSSLVTFITTFETALNISKLTISIGMVLRQKMATLELNKSFFFHIGLHTPDQKKCDFSVLVKCGKVQSFSV